MIDIIDVITLVITTDIDDEEENYDNNDNGSYSNDREVFMIIHEELDIPCLVCGVISLDILLASFRFL